MNFSEEISHWDNLLEFLYEILLLSCYLFDDSILPVEMLSVTVRGEFLPGLNCLEEISLGTKNFSVDVELDLITLFKKTIRN